MNTPGLPGYLDPSVYPPVAFIDIDGVCFNEGTDTWKYGAIEKLRFLLEDGIRLVLFTSRAPGTWLNKFVAEDIPIFGLLQKPLACAYFIVDDRLKTEQCVTDLKDLIW
jgi:hypothetical protein